MFWRGVTFLPELFLTPHSSDSCQGLYQVISESKHLSCGALSYQAWARLMSCSSDCAGWMCKHQEVALYLN